MALSIVSSLGTAVSEARHSEKADYRNDAFSFWKLPENYRVQLEQATEASEPLIRRYLFEEYKAPSTRAPSSTLTNYYRIKKFIPAPVRHWMNFVAVRARLRDVFPNWPCETVLIDLFHQWLRAGLEAIGQRDPLVEYKREAFAMWEELQSQIQHLVVQQIFRVELAPQQAAPVARNIRPGFRPMGGATGGPAGTPGAPGGNGGNGGNGGRPQPVRETAAEPVRADIWDKTGRNDPCPCGSGKKYKNCHYREIQAQRSAVR